MTQTQKQRRGLLIIFAVTVLALLYGWLFRGLDPSQLTALISAEVLGLGIGEASNIGKRATFKPEARSHNGQ